MYTFIVFMDADEELRIRRQVRRVSTRRSFTVCNRIERDDDQGTGLEGKRL